MPTGNSDGRVKNVHKVSYNVWTSWTLTAKHVFNKTFETMNKSQELFLHPSLGGQIMSDTQWRTTAWNAAWTAASICSRGERILLKDLTHKVKD